MAESATKPEPKAPPIEPKAPPKIHPLLASIDALIAFVAAHHESAPRRIVDGKTESEAAWGRRKCGQFGQAGWDDLRMLDEDFGEQMREHGSVSSALPEPPVTRDRYAKPDYLPNCRLQYRHSPEYQDNNPDNCIPARWWVMNQAAWLADMGRFRAETGRLMAKAKEKA